MDKVTVELPSELAELLKDAVASGAYASESDVVVQALEAFEAFDERRLYTPEAVAGLRRAVEEGFASGQPEPLDIEAIKREARAELARK